MTTKTANYLNGVAPTSQSMGVVNFASGAYTGGWVTGNDGAGTLTIEAHVGFTPRYVKFVNMTTGDQYEWMEGMATSATLLTTASTGANSIDTNAVIVTNSGVQTATEMATAAAGSGGAGTGTTGTVSVTYARPDPTKACLTFTSTAAASGAPVNANGSLYCWMAMG